MPLEKQPPKPTGSIDEGHSSASTRFMSKLLVHRVYTQLIVAGTRRHARRRPRLNPPKPRLAVAAAMDKNPETNKYVGYHREEVGSESLVGTVKHFDCHAFLVHGDADAWPGEEFDAEGDAAKTLHDAIKTAAGEHKSGVHQFKPGTSAVGKVKLNLSETGARGAAGDEAGDVIMFPQMRRHRLGADAVNDPAVVADFVRRAIVSGDDAGEALSHRAHLFVCTHMKRDARCGVCGPALIESIRDELKRLDIADDAVAVRGCSHTGGHKYAGNLLLFVPEKGLAAKVEDAGETKGVWYGYVTAAEIPAVLERTVMRGEVIPRLWRGSMGMRPDEHEAAAAAEAKRIGEPWPPLKTPCDACNEEGGGGGGGGGGELKDIEDVVAGGRVMKSVETDPDDDVSKCDVRVGSDGAASLAGDEWPPRWWDRVAIGGMVAGLAGMLAGVVFDR